VRLAWFAFSALERKLFQDVAGRRFIPEWTFASTRDSPFYLYTFQVSQIWVRMEVLVLPFHLEYVKVTAILILTASMICPVTNAMAASLFLAAMAA
jgi:hypothetical protein